MNVGYFYSMVVGSGTSTSLYRGNEADVRVFYEIELLKQMARVGLWSDLVHHLGTLNTPPILSLRFVKPIVVHRYSKFDRHSYGEYWGCVHHGRHIEVSLNKRVSFKVYNLGKRPCLYHNHGEGVMKTSGFCLVLDVEEGRLKWKNFRIIYYGTTSELDKMQIGKYVRGRRVRDAVFRIDRDKDIYYVAMDLIKVMESM